jgi:hypothetical protein
MTLSEIKHSLIFLVVGLVLGVIIGIGIGKHSVPRVKPGVKIERDTVTIHDTVPDYLPAPKDSMLVRWMTIRVPVEQADGTTVVTTAPQSAAIPQQVDSVDVDLPITQKHYQTENYQAWVSGFRPNLDSIEVYQKETILTEKITVTQSPSRFSFGLQAGYGYGILSKRLEPYVGLGLELRF